jgi:hypothetical protein
VIFEKITTQNTLIKHYGLTLTDYLPRGVSDDITFAIGLQRQNNLQQP